MKNERLQSDLITNVSHDIKTPLTSIINYVDLLKREELQNERAQNYIAVLDSKSQRLKQLAEDLVEASKISSGNISLNMERINLVELVHQTDGEFAERFAQRDLQVVSNLPTESVVILADGRRIWRVLENLYANPYIPWFFPWHILPRLHRGFPVRARFFYYFFHEFVYSIIFF